VNADIHLPSPVPTRKLRVVVDWNGHDRSLYNTPFLVRADVGSLPDATYLDDYGIFDVDVVTSATYRSRRMRRAGASCSANWKLIPLSSTALIVPCRR
jgi:hypothetical protein